jgi:hypothetical protein
MIQFFRKIRRKLVSEGKTVQYVKYAIGEIALVVIGILIALQINNWNQGKIDTKALHEYLIKIKSHTQEDLIQLDTLIVSRRQIVDVCKEARMSILNKTEEENLLLFMISGLAFAEYYFKPNTGGYQALKNSNYFGKINNTKLDSLLAKYHSKINDIAENEKGFNEHTVYQENYISTQFDRSIILAAAFMPRDSIMKTATTQAEFDQAFKEYTSMPSYRNVVSLAAFQIEAMINQYNELTNLGRLVIEEIDEITNNKD